MDFFYEINHIVSESAYSLSQSFEKYLPTLGKRYPAESNLTLHLALNFQSIRSEDGLIFQEVPIQTQSNNKNDKHIDMYMSCKNYSILVEAKSLWRIEHVQALIADAQRISNPNIVSQVLSRHKTTNSNRKIYSLVIGQTMSQKYVNNWNTYKSQNNNPQPFNNPKWFFHNQNVPYSSKYKNTKYFSIVWAIIEV